MSAFLVFVAIIIHLVRIATPYIGGLGFFFGGCSTLMMLIKVLGIANISWGMVAAPVLMYLFVIDVLAHIVGVIVFLYAFLTSVNNEP